MPRQITIQPSCQCGCGAVPPTRGAAFVVGHFATHRTALLAASAAGDMEATAELRLRGWLPEQGYGSYGTGRNVVNGRGENRAARRHTQMSRDYNGYVPDAARVNGRSGVPTVRSMAVYQRAVGQTHSAIPAAQALNAAGETYPTFGVEIEFHGNPDRLIDALETRGLTVVDARRDYNHDDSATDWKVMLDSTVDRGAELVSPILSGPDGYHALKTACEALKAIGATYSQQTGMHVHHGVSGLSRETWIGVCQSYTDAQALINSFLPIHRATNGMCRPYTGYQSRELEEYLDGAPLPSRHDGRRYRVVNLASTYPQPRGHGTLEFRQHNGTGTFQTIANWIRLGQRLIAAVNAGYAIDYSDLESFLRSIDCEERTIGFYTSRAETLRARREEICEHGSVTARCYYCRTA